MGSLFRSEEMTLCQLYLQSEAAYTCVSELGELGLVQFRDLNKDVNAFQRKFVNEVRRCDEMERKLRFIEKEVIKLNIPMLDTGEKPIAPQPREMVDLEATFEKLESDMAEVNKNTEALKKNFLELTELKHILSRTQVFFDEALHDSIVAEEVTFGLMGEEERVTRAQSLRLGFVAGVIVRERIPSFERMLWRACRGNVFLKQTEILFPLQDPHTGEPVNKSVFIIFFQGDQLKERVKKICEGYHATLYPCPDRAAERREMLIGVDTRIQDLTMVLNQSEDHRHRVLVQAAKHLKVWLIMVRKIKAIYHTLNMLNLDVTQKCLIAECWCASRDLDRVQLALRQATEMCGSSIPSILHRMHTKEAPPTYHRTNKFTSAFQGIIDAYGVADYREVNAAPFAIISFPFLFAVMFGDFGHGVIMFLFALWMVIREKNLLAEKSDNEIWNIFFGGRYIILLMGMFSMYTGLIYNDCFAKPLNIFGTAWTPNFTAAEYERESLLQFNPNSEDYRGMPYYFGVDPLWQISKNKITWLNSFKEKVSVLLGVSQMLLGVILSLFNHVYFKRRLNIFCEFIPQVLFLMCIFGYLCGMVVFKWIAYTPDLSCCAPSLLIDFIGMFMFKAPNPTNPNCPCVNDLPAYRGNTQQMVQTVLVVVAVICIPWILLVKPFFLRRWHYQKVARKATFYPIVDHGDDEALIDGAAPIGEAGRASAHDDDDDVDEHFDFGDVFIHQCIHTIEYCLGCVSNTASYLRLWALSLAHAQLSEVLWTMVMRIPLGLDGWLGAPVVFFIFIAWAVLTIAILLLMEGLSAFLHTLRLHWVEFQNKFYSGNGYKFLPFSFESIVDDLKAGSD
ncbi:V-type proton ATPase 116 kDa subunit a1-like [Lineus longissimus]|uniref:V-type proton ATPase 116 kDa subunit a1-like n=1 Tax=Lineus longissimus TaxID=88925 RepID=UPI002B4F1CD3